MDESLGHGALSPINGHEVVNVFYPPERTDQEPVGYVYAHKEVGGVLVRATFGNSLLDEKLVSDFWPFMERRVDRTIKRKISQVAFQASLVFELPKAADLQS